LSRLNASELNEQVVADFGKAAEDNLRDLTRSMAKSVTENGACYGSNYSDIF
jgi:hypothetical protein